MRALYVSIVLCSLILISNGDLTYRDSTDGDLTYRDFPNGDLTNGELNRKRIFNPLKIIEPSDDKQTVAENVYLNFVPKRGYAMKFQLKHLPRLLELPEFNKELPTMIYSHGFLSNGQNDPSAVPIRGAYLDRGDYNVITLDWGFYSKEFYATSAIPQLLIIAEAFADKLMLFLDTGYDVAKLHLIGHSLGAHLVGKTARHINITSNGRLIVPRVYGLDPAGPSFEGVRGNARFNSERLNKNDARFVQVIHTNGGNFGFRAPIGHVDFFPNGGEFQPGCDMEFEQQFLKPAQDVCSHNRVWQLYQETVRHPELFPAVKCDSYGAFRQNSCDTSKVAFMGFGVDTNAEGNYYLQTNANIFRFGMGDLGMESSKTILKYPFGKP